MSGAHKSINKSMNEEGIIFARITIHIILSGLNFYVVSQFHEYQKGEPLKEYLLKEIKSRFVNMIPEWIERYPKLSFPKDMLQLSIEIIKNRSYTNGKLTSNEKDAITLAEITSVLIKIL